MKAVFSVLLYFCLAITGLGIPQSASANGCITCHSNSDFFVEDRKLYTYYQDYIKSPHSDAGLTCDYCHGGDPEAETMESAHEMIPQLTDPQNKLYFKTLPETCGTCHSDKLQQFKESKHYKALMSDSMAPSCTTCHGAMNPRPDYRDIVDDSCRNCHNQTNAPKIPLVADRADEYLYRLSIAKVYLGWTTDYYESKEWPGDTEKQIADIAREYEKAVARVHSFDLGKMDKSSDDILTKLTEIFERSWEEKINMEETSSNEDTGSGGSGS
jgi:formate-dependent nitrite reductase cytochrome c552 subunit